MALPIPAISVWDMDPAKLIGCGSFATTFENSFQWFDSRAFFGSVT